MMLSKAGFVQMDIQVFNKISHVTPLLVELYDINQSYKFAEDQKKEAQAELVSVVSDLFKVGLSFSEKEVISDILIELISHAEKDLRQELARSLLDIEDVPLRLILKIANDEIDIAKIVLKNSPALSDLDLIYIIKSMGSEYWRAIAARKIMGTQVVKFLIQTRDIGTVFALAQNKYVH